MNNTTEQMLAGRKKRILDAISLKQPDQLPIFLPISVFGAKYGGITVQEAFDFKNLAKWQDINEKLLLEYQPDESTVSIFAGFEMYSGVGPSAMSNHENIKNHLLQHFKPSSIFYRSVGFGLRAVILVTPHSANGLVNEGFKTKEELSQWLGENTFTLKGKSESTKPPVKPDIHLNIIVVGETTEGFELGNLHYITTASVDKWR